MPEYWGLAPATVAVLVAPPNCEVMESFGNAYLALPLEFDPEYTNEYMYGFTPSEKEIDVGAEPAAGKSSTTKSVMLEELLDAATAGWENARPVAIAKARVPG